MKTCKIMPRVLFFILILTEYSVAQPHIDSLRIIPENPVSSDTIKIISYTFSTGAPCSLDWYGVSLIDTVITVNTNYPPGPLAVLCNSVDTVTLGVLNAGCYEARYFMSTADTSWLTTYDTDTISFCVQQSSMIQVHGFTGEKTGVYPNPFSLSATILINGIQPGQPAEIRLYDIFGSEVKRISKITNAKTCLTRDRLSRGQYFIKVLNDNKIIDIRKVIIE